MTSTTDHVRIVPERRFLQDGTLVPELLRAVRDERLAERDAHFAFVLAVPVVAARMQLSSAAILEVTEDGELPYGPDALTLREICEQEALDALAD